MNQPKPILTIKQKCGECDGIKITIDKSVEKDMQMKAGVYVCKSCKGIGHNKIEFYALRDFEKCNTHSRVPESFTHKKCQGIGYIIPKEYEPYEIKKVSEINTKEFTFNQSWNFWDEVEKHNLKEDGRVIIRRR
ncbi:MAG: hypothetical protein UR20_C0033G0003 [Candidatus Woesebacteria bacterium GW2011_GWE2_31_6]|nr:MAG: hypothetical protein UR20_C0033G0003 [Candidatus Woesebacteria bacterium GW2011_GWE2_31_6]